MRIRYLRNHPWLEILPVHVNRVFQVRVRLRGVEDVRVPGSCLGTRELDGEGGLFLLLELPRLQVEEDGPVVDVAVAVVWVFTDGVRVAPEHAPVHVVQVLSHVTLTNLERHAIWEVVDEIVGRPIDPVLLRVKRMGSISLVTVLVLAAALVGRTDAEYLFAFALFCPLDLRRLLFARSHLDAILDVLPEDVIRVDGKPVRASLHPRYGRSPIATVDLGPVLVGVRVEDVVLEVHPVLGQHGDRILGPARQLDDAQVPGAAGRRGHVVGNVLGDRVVEVRVPFRIGVLRRVSLKREQVRASREMVEVEVSL